MDIGEERKGEWFIFASVLLWSFFPVITVLSYGTVPAPLSLAWSIVLATFFFGAVVTYRKKWSEARNPLLWKYALAIALFTGVLYYGLYFIGLETTMPGNAAIIALFEVFTSFLFFNLYRRERISWSHATGAVFVVIGAVIVLGRDFSHINVGDLFVLGATFIAPFGDLFQQKARKIASSEVIMFLRSLLSIPFLFLLAYLFHAQASFTDLKLSFVFLVANGVVLLGVSKIFWIEAIHRISVTKAVALSSLAPFLTLFIAWAFLGQVPNAWQVGSLAPLVIGTLLLTNNGSYFSFGFLRSAGR